MSKSRLEVITERDFKLDMYGVTSTGRYKLNNEKNEVSPFNRKINPQSTKNVYSSTKGNYWRKKSEEKNNINDNKNNYSSVRSPLLTDTSNLNSTSNFNFKNINSPLLQNNFYKLNLQNKNLSKLTYYKSLSKNLNSTKNNSNKNSNQDNEQYDNYNPLNLPPNNNTNLPNTVKNIQKYYTNTHNQKFFSPQNTKRNEIFYSLDPNSNEDIEKENKKLNKMQKSFYQNEDVNNIKTVNFSQKNNPNNENEGSKTTTFSNEAIMNSTNKHFEINPQIVKKDFLNKSGINQEVNYYDFPTNKNIPINFEILYNYFPGYDTARSSKKQISDLIKAYAANTYQGLVRYKVVNDPNFPKDVREAIKVGFLKCDNEFLNNHALNKYGDLIDKSGSCAIVLLIVDNVCYSANVGDSRAIMSSKGGNFIQSMSIDHKPEEEEEKKRVIRNGGKIYQTKTPINKDKENSDKIVVDLFLGPTRVLPGRLSISRSFGDVEAKRVEYGGNPNVIISTPEIKVFTINKETDFIILGCDGIFDQISNEDAVESVWKIINALYNKNLNVHGFSIMGVDLIMKSSLVRKTLDNITVLLIAFENFESFINKRNKEFENYKKDNLLTEELKLKRFFSEGKDSSGMRLETENILNSNNTFNRTSRIKEELDWKNKGNKKMNFKSTELDFKKKEISSVNDLMGSPKRNKALGGNRLPPVLFSEINFRESENNKNNIFRSSIFNGNDDLKKTINFDKLKLGDNSKKIPIKVFKKSSNDENEEESDDELSDQVENNAFCASDFKSKYNHEKIKNNKNDDRLSMRRFNTEI